VRDEQLIQRVKEARPGAFDELYFSYVDRVHRQLYAVVGPDPELEDLIQLTFVSVHQKIGGFKGECAFGTWLHRLCLNVALMHLRSRQRRFRWVREKEALRPALEPTLRARPDDQAGDRQELSRIYQILSGLKPKQRLVFVLYHLEGHSLEEIAQLTECSINTVASRLRTARQALRHELSQAERLMRKAGEISSRVGGLAA